MKNCSRCFSLVPKPLIFYISTGGFSFFSHYPETKYMFLICNGILAILATSSVSSSRTSASDDQSNLDDECQLSSTPNLFSAKTEATHVDQEVPAVASLEPLQLDTVLETEEEKQEQEYKEMQAAAAEEEEEEEKELLQVKL
ncbi:unnamed protein product [Dovyalis caffra]|uniref:Uncharacterized protein n=1 Tax=Dovyalis caffra TaxID=77055 RepID=A0AAV1QSJ3_9ROSI|nr:unnamed protein product [Dovyalis caffra]